jgi:hypothetical protein
MAIAVFIENPAGLALEHHFDEEHGALLLRRRSLWRELVRS